MERLFQIARGILAGILIDLFGSLIVSILLGLALSLYLTGRGVEAGDLTQAMSELALTGGWLFVSALTGAAISVIAGFIAANLIQRDYLNPLGAMGTCLALISFTSTLDVLGTSTSILFGAITLLSVLGGGWLYQWATR